MNKWRGRTKSFDRVLEKPKDLSKKAPSPTPSPPSPSRKRKPVGVGRVVYLHRLAAGQEFEVVGTDGELRGTLRYVNSCRAEVRQSRGKKSVAIHSHEKGWREFEIADNKVVNWSPTTLVRVTGGTDG